MRRSLLALVVAFIGCTPAEMVMSGPAIHQLRSLPGVKHLSWHSAKGPPKTRLVHIADVNFLTREEFGAKYPNLNEVEASQYYEEFLDNLEMLQIEQAQLLREMVGRYAVRSAVVEGLTSQNLMQFDQSVTHVEGLQHVKMEDEVELVAELAGVWVRYDLLRLGPVARAISMGVDIEARPGDNTQLLEAALPKKTPHGEVNDQAAVEKREDAIVQNCLRGVSVAVIVLNGSNDLSNNLPNGCELIEMRTAAYELANKRY